MVLKCSINILSTNIIYAFSRPSHIHKALRYPNYFEMTPKRQFSIFHQQKPARNVTYLGEKTHTTKTFFCAFEYFRLFSAAYNYLKDYFELPGACAATRLTSKV